MKYHDHFSTRKTPQSEKIPGSTQVPNSAGGFAWEVNDWTRLERFLILGSEGGTYYIGEKKLTKDNAEVVLRLLKDNGPQVVQTIFDVSTSGRAPKNEPALFSLALAASLGDEVTRQGALDVLPDVARIGTHLFTFVEYAESFRGWGRAFKRAIGNWYLGMDKEKLAYQMIKYRQRAGWSHGDLLRLASPHCNDPAKNALFRHALGVDLGKREVKRGDKTSNYPSIEGDGVPRIVEGFDAVQNAKTSDEVFEILENHTEISWEMIPSELMTPKIWKRLIVTGMPLNALIRNLARCTANGTIKPMTEVSTFVSRRLTGEKLVKSSRIHPLNVLTAMKTYASGGRTSMYGKLTYKPVESILDALEETFYLAFQNIEPTNKRTMLGLDVSGSMGSEISGIKGVRCCEGTAAMAMVTARTEAEYMIMGFAHEFRNLGITAKSRLDEAIKKARDRNFGSTDCSLPMLYALRNGLKIDTFAVYTDSETWMGQMHPSQALDRYRQKTGIPAKLIVVSMTANPFSIADPNDAGMMDVVGFDTAAPRIMADFAR
jgi:60 kDa SS-A/Ro ribonucleoprotein